MGDHQSKTVIILGAGASREFDLPIGTDLMRHISEILSETVAPSSFQVAPTEIGAVFDECEKQNILTVEELHLASEKIINGLPYAQSIDNFIHNNKKDKAITLAGKIAIASTIIQQEQDSTLYRGPILTAGSSERQEGVMENDSWLHSYFKLLVSVKSFNQFIEGLQNTTFVSFNYDRCVQQFFWDAATAYWTSIDDAGDLTVDALNIIYPYGNVGNFYDVNGEISFGNNDSIFSILDAASSLKTFTESNDINIKLTIQDAIMESDNIMILGFGFIPINMDLLFLKEKFGKKAILCTAYGISEPDRFALRKRLINSFFWMKSREYRYIHNPIKDLIQIKEVTASQLFHEYSQYLSQDKSKNHLNSLIRD